MPPAWRAVKDDETRDIYFYHERTGRTTWEVSEMDTNSVQNRPEMMDSLLKMMNLC